LEAIVRELEADLQAQAQGAETDMGAEPEMDGGQEPEVRPEGFNAVDAGLDVRAGVTNETLEGDGDEGVSKDGKDRPSVNGVPSGKEVKAGQEVTETVTEEEVDLDEIMREIAAEENTTRSSQIAAENARLTSSLKEHRKVIELLRSRINEVTLLNSKLMYTTKIFRNYSLSEGQKKKIVEQFDRATTLRETKIIYTVLAESLTGKPTASRTVKSITEGASSVINTTKPKNQTVLNEGTTQVSRMQKLAGIVRS